MKKTMIAALMIPILAASCSKDEIKTYGELTPNRFLSFQEEGSVDQNDTVFVSFVSFGEKDAEYPIVVESSGFSESEQQYSVKVSREGTTMQAGDYQMPSSFSFAPRAVKDTFYVKLIFSGKYDTDTLSLSLEFEENEVFKKGPSTAIHRVLMVHNAIVKPAWWTSQVASYYFGTYSDRKYKTYMSAIGHDLTGCSNNIIRYYALLFKQWLEDQKASGNTVKEDNGTEMKVAVGQ
jgi:hypothetical protein